MLCLAETKSITNRGIVKKWSKVMVLAGILAADQISKWLILDTLVIKGSPLVIIPKILNLNLVLNPGVAFGLFAELPDEQRRIAIASVSLLALIVVMFLLLKEAKDDWWSQGALMAILAGAFGNIIDRFRFDAVVDFIEVFIFGYHWPNFNVADSAICVGVAILIVRMLFQKKAIPVI